MYIHIHRHTDRQTEIHTNWQARRQTNKQVGREADRRAVTASQAVMKDRQADRQTERRKSRRTDSRKENQKVGQKTIYNCHSKIWLSPSTGIKPVSTALNLKHFPTAPRTLQSQDLIKIPPNILIGFSIVRFQTGVCRLSYCLRRNNRKKFVCKGK